MSDPVITLVCQFTDEGKTVIQQFVTQLPNIDFVGLDDPRWTAYYESQGSPYYLPAPTMKNP